jgi:hypothetical protein
MSYSCILTEHYWVEPGIVEWNILHVEATASCSFYLQNAFCYLDLSFMEFKLESYLFKLLMYTADKLKTLYCLEKLQHIWSPLMKWLAFCRMYCITFICMLCIFIFVINQYGWKSKWPTNMQWSLIPKFSIYSVSVWGAFHIFIVTGYHFVG